MRLELRGQSGLMSDLNDVLAGSLTSIEETSNFVTRSTAARAKIAIRTGGRAGRVYERENPTRMVQASAPGEAPMNDMGFLADSIFFHLFNTSGMVGHVFVDAPYAVDLELGTDKILPRPFLHPAFREALQESRRQLKTTFEAQL